LQLKGAVFKTKAAAAELQTEMPPGEPAPPPCHRLLVTGLPSDATEAEVVAFFR